MLGGLNVQTYSLSLIILLRLSSAQTAVDECHQNQPYALSLTFTDINGDAPTPSH